VDGNLAEQVVLQLEVTQVDELAAVASAQSLRALNLHLRIDLALPFTPATATGFFKSLVWSAPAGTSVVCLPPYRVLFSNIKTILRGAPFLSRQRQGGDLMLSNPDPNVKMGKYSEIKTLPTTTAITIKIKGSINDKAAVSAVCTSSS